MHAQSDPDRPLPDVPTLMHAVEAQQKAAESLARDYLYHQAVVSETVDGHGAVKKTETEEADIFYVAGARLRRITKKDGKELSPDEQRKEAERIDKEIARAKEQAARATPGAEERDVVTVARFLELGTFSNARRVTLDGRDTIAVDFAGDPKVKTHSRFEGAIREMEGTIWVDEQDRALRKLEGRFVHPFKIGGGLLADIKQDSRFRAAWTKVNDEVWLPSTAGGEGGMRVLLFLNFNGSLRVSDSGYRKFKITAKMLPGATEPEKVP